MRGVLLQHVRETWHQTLRRRRVNASRRSLRRVPLNGHEYNHLREVIASSCRGRGKAALRRRLISGLKPTIRFGNIHPRRVGYIPGERPIVGQADQAPGNFGLSAKRLPVAMIDSTLLIGEIDVLDGASFELRPRRIGQRGFSGTWAWNGGFVITVDSAGRVVTESGTFCADRGQEPAPDERLLRTAPQR